MHLYSLFYLFYLELHTDYVYFILSPILHWSYLFYLQFRIGPIMLSPTNYALVLFILSSIMHYSCLFYLFYLYLCIGPIYFISSLTLVLFVFVLT